MNKSDYQSKSVDPINFNGYIDNPYKEQYTPKCSNSINSLQYPDFINILKFNYKLLAIGFINSTEIYSFISDKTEFNIINNSNYVLEIEGFKIDLSKFKCPEELINNLINLAKTEEELTLTNISKIIGIIS